MPKDFPAIRILPMSDQIPGFRDRSIADVQEKTFLRDLIKNGGRFLYRTSGLNADPGTLILFQFQARIIALAIFLRDEKWERKRNDCSGEMIFDPSSFRTFDPLDAAALRKAFPFFKRFGHIKQFLNPTCYAAFRRQLKHVRQPG